MKCRDINVNVGIHIAVRICRSLGFSYCCLHGNSGCLGCDIRPKLNPSHDDPFKGQSNHASKQSQATLSDGFWTTSTYEMDNAAVQFCGSISSTNTLHQMHDAHGDGCSSKPSEFVNIGLILWNESRQNWIGNRKPESEAQQLREPRLSWNATYESLLGSNKPFQKSIPLAEMIDFLVDIWEQEGMYQYN